MDVRSAFGAGREALARRRLLLAAAALATVPAGAAEPAPAKRRLGVLLLDRPESWTFLVQLLRQALAELGWVEGGNLSVDWRFAEGEVSRLDDLAAQLVRSGVDAVLARGSPATLALQRATHTLPIVTGVGDPVGSGFAASYARPGGNITGLSYALVETQLKQLEQLRELVPRLARLVVVLPAKLASFAQQMTAPLQAAARASRLATQMVPVASLEDLDKALAPAPDRAVSAAFMFSLTTLRPGDIAETALRHRMPTTFEQREYVEAGGLMSYRFHWDDQTRSTAIQLDKVLRGVKPEQIPFELPTRSEFVVNAKTARALGLSVPPSLLVRADEVIR